MGSPRDGVSSASLMELRRCVGLIGKRVDGAERDDGVQGRDRKTEATVCSPSKKQAGRSKF